MRQPIVLCASLLVVLAFAHSADAATLYASPGGTATTGCTRDMPCDLTSAATAAMAGDTVILMDGVYKTALNVPNSGTAAAWITFQADECATPIIEGAGVDPTSTDQTPGVSSTVGTYLRFVGLVSRGWNAGFSNGWQDNDRATPPTSNGHLEYKNCIADGNGRTGFTFFSAEGLHLQNNISAHNGSSTMESWSSGITLFEAQGTANLVEGNLSFENMDAHTPRPDVGVNGTHTDGNGFIVDEGSNGATLINNVAFGNGGSCLRLTKSTKTKFINNTCFHNAADPEDSGPPNPGEVYFTKDSAADPTSGVTFMNNMFIGTGKGPGATPIYNQPSSGWTTNIVTTGAGTYFTSPADGTNPNPDFTLLAAATTVIGKGTAGAGVPTNDIGLDPKCVTKKVPTPIGMMVNGSWWQYSIDYDYIKRIGGVAKCFNPGVRAAAADVGAYKAGALTVSSGTCVPTAVGGGGSGSGGASGTAGAGAIAGGSSSSAGAGGGVVAAGGASSVGGNSATAGAATSGSTAGAATSSTAGSGATSGPTGGGATSGAAAGTSSDSGCGCRVGPSSSGWNAVFGLGSLGLLAFGIRRRRQARGSRRAE